MTQNGEILRHLQENGKINVIEAERLYGCRRLSARIFDLKKLGHLIRTDKIIRNNRYGHPTPIVTYIYEGMCEE